ncbi:zf-HC2 domain-containing protein [Rhizomonospora bruguierae]|uniref:zf-HC2 domain-containing protein n=1 Tax=Rhizomonospora bruguierae TaxID=1581705 RepID=UPI001BCFE2E3|nr:zf-HC2 domain-containing protein [Micromonospora sp. NBRC 107566]
MSVATDGDEHVRFDLGLYVLGKLPLDEQRAVRRHLDQCSACLADYQELRDLTDVLASLREDERRALADQLRPQTAPRALRVPVAEPSPAPAVSPIPIRRNGWFTARAKVMAVAAAFVLVGGIGIGAALTSGERGPVGVSVSDTDEVTGVTLSVTLEPRESGSIVRAVTAGLTPGQQIQLIAVTTDGATVVVDEIIASHAEEEMVATVSKRPGDIAFFTVTKVGGSVLARVVVPH